MHIVRFTTGNNPQYGVLEEGKDHIVVLKNDPLFAPVEHSGALVALDEVRLLSPVIPRSKVVCVGRNYADHARELGNEVPPAPILFLKPNTAVIGPDDPIVLPPWSQHVDHEVELAVVIKTLAKDVKAAEAGDVILGYTVANDCSARDIQKADGQWTRAKGWDTSCPLGPWINVDPTLDVANLNITCRVNGEARQNGNTGQMLWSVPYIVEYVSHSMTLLPGDIILTGTPAGVGPLQHGDLVECEIENIGTLPNRVIRR
ncbi:MAG: fumarylacetoacetate hydrolase family protein [Actinomycetaceae bacterium]|nr:fumarylacetoacetate hydrolase family protein [Actinomycetaceae bacterium]